MIPSVPTLRSSDLTEVVDRAAPAEHLVDRSVPEAGVVAQALGLVGMLDEGEHRVVDEVAGGLVAGHHERDEEQVELEVVEALAVRSEEHTSELKSLLRTSYADFCLKKNNTT